MKFEVQCDMTDGIVLVDPYFLEQMNDDILNAMNIYLDPQGITELADDFPGEDWNDVYKRETAPFKAFAEKGKLWIHLIEPCEKEFTLQQSDCLKSSEKVLVESGKLGVVLASELLQCLYYPELEMELLGEIETDNGCYNVSICDDTINLKRA